MKFLIFKKFICFFIFIFFLFNIPSAFSGTIRLRDEGAHQGYVAVLDFVGSGITATRSGITGTITLDLTGLDLSLGILDADSLCLRGNISIMGSYYGDGSKLTGISTTTDEIKDADNDTKVQVEENADEDIIRFDVGGTEILTVSSLGACLIGNFSNTGNIYSGGDAYLTGDLAVNGGGITYGTNLRIQGSTDSTTGFQILDADGGTPIVNIDTTNERVGIGTAVPGAKLEISGDIKAEQDDITPLTVIQNDVPNVHILGSSGEPNELPTAIIESTEGRLQFVAENSGNAGAMFVFSMAPSSGDNKHWVMHHRGPNSNNRWELGYQTSSAAGWNPNSAYPKFIVTTDGDVGIGITSPNDKLEIGKAGALRLSSADVAEYLRLYHDDTDGYITTGGTNDGEIYLIPGGAHEVRIGSATSAHNLRIYGECYVDLDGDGATTVTLFDEYDDIQLLKDWVYGNYENLPEELCKDGKVGVTVLKRLISGAIFQLEERVKKLEAKYEEINN